MNFNGLGTNLGNLSRLSNATSRSISAENVYGDKGRGAMAAVTGDPQPEIVRLGQPWSESTHAAARELGRGWNVRPCIVLPKNSTVTLMDIDGPGAIQHFWCTVEEKRLRDLILRIYWDGADAPSVEVPLGDFFCNGWNKRVNILSLPINVNPSGGMNCYFPMPFRKHARVTLENRCPEEIAGFYYTFNYVLTGVPEDEAYFHAQFRRTNPLGYQQEFVILDGVEGQGHFVGVYMAWQQNSSGWWGEGEFKAFLDGDTEFPTICGTGTEDYFGGAWCFQGNYSAPFLGYPTGSSDSKPGNRHGLYRFHVLDPIRFKSNLRLHMQALGWRSEARFLPLQDDISSVAYWYQTHPALLFPKLPSRNELEVI